MERFGPGRNFPEKVVHLQRWYSVRSDLNLRSIFKNYRFQSHFNTKSSKFRSKRKWNASGGLEILFLLNNVEVRDCGKLIQSLKERGLQQMCCFVILLLFNKMQMSVRRFSAIPHHRDNVVPFFLG